MRILFLLIFSQIIFAAQYEVIIDAGSSGSRANLFRMDEKVQPVSVFKEKAHGGIQSLAKHPERTHLFVDPIIEHLKSKLGEPIAQQTPIHLLATGGVRKLRLSEQEKVLKLLKSYFNNRGYKHFDASILTGDKEGLFSWIAVNYLEGRFQERTSKTLGVLDMGGASTQITFVPKEKPRLHGFDTFLFGRKYHVYSYSYEGLGQKSAMLDFAVPACFQKGLDTDENILSEVGLNKILGPSAPALGDYSVCKDSILKHIQELCVETELCGLKDVYQPPLKGEFVAISGFAQLASPKVLGLQSKLDSQELDQVGDKICSMSWAEFKSYGKDLPKFLSTACFETAYYSALLSGQSNTDSSYNGYGFSGKTHKLAHLLEVNGLEISWALGAAVYFQQNTDLNADL